METNILYNDDCLEIMPTLGGGSIDLILTDLPYGTSACKWDMKLPFEELWGQFTRLIKPDGAIVLFASQPFTSALIMSNLEMYKYNWVWVKDNATNFLNKNYQPGKITEDICVFGKMATSYSKKGNMVYNPQLSEGKPYKTINNVERRTNAVIRSTVTNTCTENEGTRLPNNVLYFNRDKNKVHPTQKPVALLEYLIKTYTNEGGIVLDATMGSGSTCLAAKNTGRRYIGIEKEKEYYDIAVERLNE